MADHAAWVQGLVVCMAIATSLWVGWLNRGPKHAGKIVSMVGLSIVWGVGATLVAIYFNELCRSHFQLCPERGDGNMAYWFFPFFALPFYLFSMLAFGSRDKALAIGPSPYDQAVDSVLLQLKSQKKIWQRCPECKAVLIVENRDATETVMTRRVRVRCACGKCDQLFDLLDHQVDEK